VHDLHIMQIFQGFGHADQVAQPMAVRQLVSQGEPVVQTTSGCESEKYSLIFVGGTHKSNNIGVVE